jgi:hypothetical protein
MRVTLDNKDLIPGEYYIVNPASPGSKGKKYRVLFLDSLFKMKGHVKSRQYAIAGTKRQIDSFLKIPGRLKIFPAAILELVEGRLVWSVRAGDPLYDLPYIQLKPGSLPTCSREISIEIEQKLIPEHPANNIAGYIPGTLYPDSFILISAHYDHLGRMGSKTYFPGANDNASGTAMLLDLVRYYTIAENRPAYSIMFVSFAAEEAGLLGSKYFVDHPLVPLQQIAFVINMDLMANGQDGMMVVNATVFPHYYNRLKEINSDKGYLKEIKSRGKAANSDHYWFSEKGVKAFFFYLLGDYPYYHDIYDTAEKPTLAGYDGAFHLITDFISGFPY